MDYELGIRLDEIIYNQRLIVEDLRLLKEAANIKEKPKVK